MLFVTVFLYCGIATFTSVKDLSIWSTTGRQFLAVTVRGAETYFKTFLPYFLPVQMLPYEGEEIQFT